MAVRRLYCKQGTRRSFKIKYISRHFILHVVATYVNVCIKSKLFLVSSTRHASCQELSLQYYTIYKIQRDIFCVAYKQIYLPIHVPTIVQGLQIYISITCICLWSIDIYVFIHFNLLYQYIYFCFVYTYIHAYKGNIHWLVMITSAPKTYALNHILLNKTHITLLRYASTPPVFDLRYPIFVIYDKCCCSSCTNHHQSEFINVIISKNMN